MRNGKFSLQKYNTFGIDACADTFFSYNNIDDLILFLQNDFDKEKPFFILGGGSNVLFTSNYQGTIIHPETKGITITQEDDNDVFVAVAAGEIWDDFVQWAVDNNLHGVENLSYIPGCVGASPVQNIGAYGSEAKDAIHEVHCISIAEQTRKTFSKEECKFGYRDSIFKHECANKYIVETVVFKLQKDAPFNLSYGSLNTMIDEKTATLQKVRETIIQIRKEKLPDPKEIGSAGSFFKNPIIPENQANTLRNKFPKIVTYPAPNGNIKVAAGWLIDSLGLKGFCMGGAKVHEKQALVLTNAGNATGNDVVALAQHIQEEVKQTYNIQIEPEVIFL